MAAHIAQWLIYQATEVVNNTVEELKKTDGTESVVNGTEPTKPKSTPEGMMVAYVSLVVMALLPIWVGAFKSVRHHESQKKSLKETGEQPETMTSKDAMMFPLVASCALFGLYIFFKLFSKEYINLLLTGYFFILGVLALCHILAPIVAPFLPEAFPRIPYHLLFTQEDKDGQTVEIVNFKFDTNDILCFFIASAFGAWYLLKKHWIANNIFGIAFAVNGVELLHLNSVTTGCILLGGLFFYDVFWVFGTDVMVTVAKSFEAPIKLVFPQDLLENGLSATNFAMLGLGDIVIPGIFIALLLRYDKSLKRGSYTYFNTAFIAYILGLVMTIVVMSYFKHAQPALLYLVPACIGLPLLVAAVKGDLKSMFSYEDHPEVKDEKVASEKTTEKKKVK
ncbi:Minor histocompatibility antigen H13 [Halotydeus destructor]|nr:Minor histocompatibility antigen H13 [Halotydeus destructor]